MKKLNLFLGLGLISMTLMFNSCSEDVVHPAPTVSFDQASPVVLGIGVTSATLTGTIVAEAKLENVQISKTVGTTETSLVTITDFASGNVTTTDDINYTFNYTLDGITENTTLKVTANDKDAQFTSESIDIEVTLAGDIFEYTAVLLGAQSNNDAPSALDAYNGVRYSFNASNPTFDYAPDHKTDIDIIYYYGSANLATLAAPADPSMDGTGTNSFDWTAGWDPKNETLFGSTSIDFDNVTDDSEISEITGLSSTKMTSLAVGDAIAFELVEGKKGLIKVAELNIGSAGSITIHVKVQE